MSWNGRSGKGLNRGGGFGYDAASDPYCPRTKSRKFKKQKRQLKKLEKLALKRPALKSTNIS